MKYVICILLIVNLSDLIGQSSIKSYGLNIANSMNAIGVGYQDFESMGLGTNFINKGQSEFSFFNPMIGVSLTADWNPMHFMGRLSVDNKSGYIKDELVPNALSMSPQVTYLSFETGIVFNPVEKLSLYAGPSLNLLLQNTYGKIDDKASNQTLTNMNSPIPGIFVGIATDIPLDVNLASMNIHCAPYFESALIFNQRMGEFPQNQDGFDNIWSTFSLRTGIRFYLNVDNDIPTIVLPFTLHIPKEMAGKRSMSEHIPFLMQWSEEELSQAVSILLQKSFSNHASAYKLITSPELQSTDEIRSHRITHHSFALFNLVQQAKKTSDTIVFTSCSSMANSHDLLTAINNLTTYSGLEKDRIQLKLCTQLHEHEDMIKGTLQSGSIPMAIIHFPSISPIENTIVCTIHEQLKSWNIEIIGPQQYRKTVGPLNDTITYFDGSELLQGEAGSGAYRWDVLYEDANGMEQRNGQEFQILMSNENKMRGSAFTYIPNFYSDSILYSLIQSDLSKELNHNDEIIMVIDEHSSEYHLSMAKDLLNIVSSFVEERKIMLKKPPYIVLKGEENRCYPSDHPLGIVYEKGIRMEIIH